LQTASTSLRQTNFKPWIHEVILDPRDAAESILIKTHLWDNKAFEEEGEEEEVDEVEQEIRQKEEEAARKPASSPVGKRRRTSKPVSAAANATRRKRS
jgi:hypothetical protein